MKVCGARSRSVECIAALRRHNTPSKCRWIPRAPADFHYRSSLLLFFRYFKRKKIKKQSTKSKIHKNKIRKRKYKNTKYKNKLQ